MMIIRSSATAITNCEIHQFGPRMTKYAIVIPILNEGQTIIAQLHRMQGVNLSIDVLLVDGGSCDGSTCHDLLSRAGVRSLLVTYEQGLGTAIQRGMEYALAEGYEGVVTMDGNGKDGVDAIPHFVG